MASEENDARTAEDATLEVISSIRERISKILERENKPRYVDEFSYHALRLPFVNKVLPEAKVVMMVRDPADVIPEMMYFWQYRDSIFEAWRRHRKTISLDTLPRLARKFLVNYVAVRFRGHRKSWGPTPPDAEETRELSLPETVAQLNPLLSLAMRRI